MAFQTAVTFLLGSITVLLLTVPGNRRSVRYAASFLAVVVASLGLIFALGYFYGAPFFSGPAAIPMAINTSLSFVALGVGLLLTAGPETPPLRPLVGPSVHARLLRAFLPFTALTVCLVAWLMYLIRQRESAPSAALVSALLVVAAILLVSIICVRIARTVGGDLERVATMNYAKRKVGAGTTPQSCRHSTRPWSGGLRNALPRWKRAATTWTSFFRSQRPWRIPITSKGHSIWSCASVNGSAMNRP